MSNNQRNSILCPNCRKLISVSEPRCPYCGTGRPGSWWKNNLWTRGFRNPDQVIKAIITINIGMYALSLFLFPSISNLKLNPLTFLSPSTRSLLELGATGTYPIDRYHYWWSLISANYLHGSILHILFNMLALRQLAPPVIREYGIYRMLVIYILSGAIGLWVSYAAGVYLTIGASAAVCGLVGAILFYGKSRGGAYGRALYKQVGLWVVFLFIFGFLVPGINNWGHGGGLLAGAGLGALLGYQDKKKENLAHKLLAAGCVVLTLSVLLWVICFGLYSRMMS